MRRLAKFALWFLPLLASLSFAQGIELACPAGTTPLQPTGVTSDVTTGGIKQWQCVDVKGNVYSTVNGTLNLCKFGTVRIVDSQNSCGWTGTDVHGWINAAYADIPTPSATVKPAGKILVMPKPDGTCYSVTTQLLLNTNGKPINLDFQGSCIDASAMTATDAQVFDWGQAPGINGSIKNEHLKGPCTTVACVGVTSTGMVLGSVNGLVGTLLENIYIGTAGNVGGFLSGITSPFIGYINQCINCNVIGSNVGLNLTGGSEGVKFVGGCICQNNIGVQTAGSGSEVQFIATQFDDNASIGVNITNTTTFNVTLINPHFENAGLGALQAITDARSGGSTKIIGGDIQEDRTSGTNPQFITMSGNWLDIQGMHLFANAGITVTRAVNITGGNGTFLHFILGSNNISATSNTGSQRVQDTSLRVDTTVPINIYDFMSIGGREEGTCPTPVANFDMFCWSSSTNSIQASYNGGTFLNIPQAITTSFTTTAAASNNVTVTGMTASGHCTLTPTNSGAAGGIASVFISAKAANQITVSHTATAGWTFDVFCTPQ